MAREIGALARRLPAALALGALLIGGYMSERLSPPDPVELEFASSHEQIARIAGAPGSDLRRTAGRNTSTDYFFIASYVGLFVSVAWVLAGLKRRYARRAALAAGILASAAGVCDVFENRALVAMLAVDQGPFRSPVGWAYAKWAGLFIAMALIAALLLKLRGPFFWLGLWLGATALAGLFSLALDPLLLKFPVGAMFAAGLAAAVVLFGLLPHRLDLGPSAP